MPASWSVPGLMVDRADRNTVDPKIYRLLLNLAQYVDTSGVARVQARGADKSAKRIERPKGGPQVERSEKTRGNPTSPDSASLHPGYMIVTHLYKAR